MRSTIGWDNAHRAQTLRAATLSFGYRSCRCLGCHGFEYRGHLSDKPLRYLGNPISARKPSWINVGQPISLRRVLPGERAEGQIDADELRRLH